MKTRILGVDVDVVTKKEAVAKAVKFLGEDKPHVVFTPNPEMIILAGKDLEFKEILNNADLVIPDGIGVVIASKFNENKLPERVAGYEFNLEVFEETLKEEYLKENEKPRIYFLGSAPKTAEIAKEKLEMKYKGIKIVGARDGYFDEKMERIIIEEIKEKKADIVLVGLGMGKQEKWIDKHKNELGARLLVGVGGSLDGYSEKIKRSPEIFCKLNLEWLYRLLSQPKRLKRQVFIPIFVFKVLLNRKDKRSNNDN